MRSGVGARGTEVRAAPVAHPGAKSLVLGHFHRFPSPAAAAMGPSTLMHLCECLGIAFLGGLDLCHGEVALQLRVGGSFGN